MIWRNRLLHFANDPKFVAHLRMLAALAFIHEQIFLKFSELPLTFSTDLTRTNNGTGEEPEKQKHLYRD